MRAGGLEPPCRKARPPKDRVDTNFTTLATAERIAHASPLGGTRRFGPTTIAVSLRLRVAVRTQPPKVAEAVVVIDPVDVIDMKYELTSAPLRDSAQLALVLPSELDKAPCEAASFRIGRVLAEDDLVRIDFAPTDERARDVSPSFCLSTRAVSACA